ncbi:putative zinc finger protein GLIS1-like [Scophthalmus maximus]|uniref:Putative zinc finger protein GLIS1-like n=1 Tax=Scophthalmus maximus TaxID=52904 RepID=A0A2U9C5R9_SCOMX|nr:putative zinc finger protein GLIS1-like [Scophthalmus maximus]
MQNSPALFGMVSHCQAPVFTDFPGVALSVYSGGKADMCARRAGGAAFGAQMCRSPHDAAAHMNCGSPKRVGAAEPRAHLSAKTPRSCFSLAPMQGRRAIPCGC